MHEASIRACCGLRHHGPRCQPFRKLGLIKQLRIDLHNWWQINRYRMPW